MEDLRIICNSCYKINKIKTTDLKLYKEFNCYLCSLIILIVDEELLNQVNS